MHDITALAKTWQALFSFLKAKKNTERKIKKFGKKVTRRCLFIVQKMCYDVWRYHPDCAKGTCRKVEKMRNPGH